LNVEYMDKRDVSVDQVGVAARKAGIRMLPSIGKPDLLAAPCVKKPLHRKLEWIKTL